MNSRLHTHKLTIGAAALVLAATIGGCGGADDADQTDPDDAPLALGESHESDGLAITLAEVVRGSTADLASLELEPDERDSTPYYARLRVENTGDRRQAYNPFYLHAQSDAGEELTRLEVLGVFPPCGPSTTGPIEPGDASDICVVFLAEPDVTPAAVGTRQATWEIAPSELDQPASRRP